MLAVAQVDDQPSRFGRFVMHRLLYLTVSSSPGRKRRGTREFGVLQNGPERQQSEKWTGLHDSAAQRVAGAAGVGLGLGHDVAAKGVSGAALGAGGLGHDDGGEILKGV